MFFNKINKYNISFNIFKKNKKFFCKMNDLNLHENNKKNNETYFGYKIVSNSEKPTLVSQVFNNIAEKYDLMNDLMSFGIHRIWKNEFVNNLNPIPNSIILDVAGGTGN